MKLRALLFACLVITRGFGFVSVTKYGISRTRMIMRPMKIVIQELNPRDERRRILKSPNYNRMGFKEEKLDVSKVMSSEFTSPLVAELRANKGTITRGNVTIKLAEFYGFCWGVERAVRFIFKEEMNSTLLNCEKRVKSVFLFEWLVP